MMCPRCKEDLAISEILDQKIETCRSCGGMWFDKNQLNDLLVEIDGDVESCSIDDNPHADNYPTIRCQRCADIDMKKVNFLDYSNIILDYCESCGGFWLDKDELSMMEDYIHKVEEGSHRVRDRSAFHLLARLSEIAYSLFK